MFTWSNAIEFLIAVGFFETGSTLVKRMLNRRADAQKLKRETQETQIEARRADLNEAQVIQGMSIALLEPLESQLARTNKSLNEASARADQLREDLRHLEDQFDALIDWAREAKSQLEANGITMPPIPQRRPA